MHVVLLLFILEKFFECFLALKKQAIYLIIKERLLADNTFDSLSELCMENQIIEKSENNMHNVK